jgi:glycosyltransferase involved in cell wall biosynthesis
MRVLFVASTLSFGGAERQLVALANGLGSRGHEVHVALLYRGGPLERDLASGVVHVHSLEKRGRWDILAVSRRLARLVGALRPNVVHSYLVVPNIIAALAQAGSPRTPLVWGVRTSRMDEARYSSWDRIAFWLERRLVKIPDLIIANSRDGGQVAVEMGAPASAVAVVSNGIDTSAFVRDAEAGLQIRREWGIEPDEFLIGVVGRIDPMKGHDVFLKAARMVPSDPVPVRFVIVGSGPDAHVERLKSRALSLGIHHRIVWAQARRDIVAVYSGLDLMVLPSRFGEGFPNVVGEAMACGTPCVVTNVGDSAMVVGECGRVVPAGDVDALASALRDMAALSDVERTALRAQPRARIVDHFSVPTLVANTLRLLETLSPADAPRAPARWLTGRRE